MSELVDQSGFYKVDQGESKGTLIAMIYDLNIKRYIIFNEKGLPIGMTVRNEIVRTVNCGVIHLVKESKDTIQSMLG